jgi:geranylgeranyl pyrophosphate synthase
MTTQQDPTQAAVDLIMKRGGKALEIAQKEIQKSPRNVGEVSAALRYFSKTTLSHASPLFPALMSLSCEASGGEPRKTEPIAAALMFFAFAADLHDDVIDKSKEKYSKKTVLGKYGESVALLVGDALLVQGLMLLQRETGQLPRRLQDEISTLVVDAFFRITKGEAKETQLTASKCMDPEEYLKAARLKASVPKLFCKVGAILGTASPKLVDDWGRYGEAVGLVGLLKDEFTDMVDYPELYNRIKEGCPPLPMLYALKDPETKGEIQFLMENLAAQPKNLSKLAEVVLRSKEVENLRLLISRIANREIKELNKITIKVPIQRKEAAVLLHALNRP